MLETKRKRKKETKEDFPRTECKRVLARWLNRRVVAECGEQPASLPPCLSCVSSILHQR